MSETLDRNAAELFRVYWLRQGMPDVTLVHPDLEKALKATQQWDEEKMAPMPKMPKANGSIYKVSHSSKPHGAQHPRSGVTR